MAFLEEGWEVWQLILRAWYGVGTCGVGARLILKLVRQFLSKAFCIVVLCKGCQVQGRSVAVDPLEKIVFLTCMERTEGLQL